MITSVGEHSYVALPRGGVNDFHALIVPIECVPSRIHLSTDAKAEIKRYEQALENFYAQQQCNTLRFERAIRTKGRDHMQEHLIPVPRNSSISSLTAFLQVATRLGIKFHEMQV